MTKIKIIIVLVFFCFGFQNSYGQSYMFSTSGISVLGKNPRGGWGEWSELELMNILVKLDTDKNRILLYSEEVQLFAIEEYIPLEENETDSVYAFECVDNAGNNCVVSIITRKNQDNRKQLYIKYPNKILLYNIHNYK